MIKLFIVIYVMSEVAGTVGPLSYGMDECRKKAAEFATGCKEHPAAAFKCSDLHFVCEEHLFRPINTYGKKREEI